MLFGDGTGQVSVENVIVCIVHFLDQGTQRDAERKEVDVFGTVIRADIRVWITVANVV